MKAGMKMLVAKMGESRSDYGAKDAYAENEMYSDYNARSNSGGMNYGEGRFRDRGGREHYDNGRFAPRNTMGETEGVESRRRGSDGRFRSEHYPPPVYERGEGGAEMNRVIGFAQPEFEQNYRANAAYQNVDHAEHRSSQHKMGGAKTDNEMFDERMAHEWMNGLQNADGSRGAHWTMDQVKLVMKQKELDYDPIEFWVAMNAVYSDLCKEFKKYNINNVDAYVDFAKAMWLEDKDAVDDKLATYYECIVQK